MHEENVLLNEKISDINASYGMAIFTSHNQ